VLIFFSENDIFLLLGVEGDVGKGGDAAVIYNFRIYAPTHAFERDDGLHRSRRGGMYFLSCAKESTKEARFGRAYCRMTRGDK